MLGSTYCPQQGDFLSTEVWQGTRFSINGVDHQLVASWASSSAMTFAETGSTAVRHDESLLKAENCNSNRKRTTAETLQQKAAMFYDIADCKIAVNLPNA